MTGKILHIMQVNLTTIIWSSLMLFQKMQAKLVNENKRFATCKKLVNGFQAKFTLSFDVMYN